METHTGQYPSSSMHMEMMRMLCLVWKEVGVSLDLVVLIGNRSNVLFSSSLILHHCDFRLEEVLIMC
jgi:hypothetical protein